MGTRGKLMAILRLLPVMPKERRNVDFFAAVCALGLSSYNRPTTICTFADLHVGRVPSIQFAVLQINLPDEVIEIVV